MQSGYFFPENSLLTSDSLENIPDVQTNVFADTPASSFADILSREDADGAKKFLDMLHQNFFKITVFCRIRSNTCITNFFSVWKMHVISKKLQVPVMWKALPKQLTTVSPSLNCIKHSWTRLLSFFRKAESSSQENPTIFLIKDYISQNYMHETLSVKDINEHVFLSTSYVCTFFKSETGQTLNQYLTEYRMEKAKQLLKDARFKISDISSLVGYSDGNY